MTETAKQEPEQIQENAKELLILRKRKEHLSQQLQTFKFVWWGWIVSFFIGVFIFYLLISIKSTQDSSFNFLTKIILGGFLGNFTYVYFVGLFRFYLSSKLRQIEYKLIEAGAIN
jgi:hypothetical protein